MSYQVLIDDNFHYQDEAHRLENGAYATVDEAVAACRLIVDEFLTGQFKPGMTAEALFSPIRRSVMTPTSYCRREGWTSQVLGLELCSPTVLGDRRSVIALSGIPPSEAALMRGFELCDLAAQLP